jgi:hypothetical protein
MSCMEVRFRVFYTCDNGVDIVPEATTCVDLDVPNATQRAMAEMRRSLESDLNMVIREKGLVGVREMTREQVEEYRRLEQTLEIGDTEIRRYSEPKQ